MDEKPSKQAVRYIQNAENILIVTHEKMDGDGLGSGLALYLALNKLGKKTDFLSLDKVPATLNFLPSSSIVSDKIPVGNDFVISLDCTNTVVDKLKYNKIGRRLNILISPQNGTFSETDVTFRRGQTKYELVIALDCGDINQLGKLYKENIDLFYDSVVLNIDHHISNDYFGKINLVDPTATSTAEIVLSLIDTIQTQASKKLIDEDIATCLLTGITVDTNSFQNQNTSPKAFSVAAQLLAYGARQQEIVKHIYKTHNLSTLKLWGKALSNLKYDKELKVVWTYLSKNDFLDVKANDDEVQGLMDELITGAPGAEVAILLREIGDNIVKGSIRTMINSIDANDMAKIFKGGGHKRASGFRVESDSIEKAVNFVMKEIFDFQRKRQNSNMAIDSVEMMEDTIMKIPEDPATRDFITKVRDAANVDKNEQVNKSLRIDDIEVLPEDKEEEIIISQLERSVEKKSEHIESKSMLDDDNGGFSVIKKEEIEFKPDRKLGVNTFKEDKEEESLISQLEQSVDEKPEDSKNKGFENILHNLNSNHIESKSIDMKKQETVEVKNSPSFEINNVELSGKSEDGLNKTKKDEENYDGTDMSIPVITRNLSVDSTQSSETESSQTKEEPNKEIDLGNVSITRDIIVDEKKSDDSPKVDSNSDVDFDQSSFSISRDVKSPVSPVAKDVDGEVGKSISTSNLVGTPQIISNDISIKPEVGFSLPQNNVIDVTNIIDKDNQNVSQDQTIKIQSSDDGNEPISPLNLQLKQ